MLDERIYESYIGILKDVYKRQPGSLYQEIAGGCTKAAKEGQSMSILLEAEHLTKIFTQIGKNPFKAVNDVSFTLKKGETLGIVGESGSGKSTIAKPLTRLTDITEGTLKFEGKDITRLKQSQLKEVYGDIQLSLIHIYS